MWFLLPTVGLVMVVEFFIPIALTVILFACIYYWIDAGKGERERKRRRRQREAEEFDRWYTFWGC